MWPRSQQWLAPNSTTNLLPPKFALLWACSKIFLLFLKFLSRRGANNGLCRTLVHPFTPNFSHIMGQINSICPIPIIFDYIVTQLKTIELQLARANNLLKFSILIYSFRGRSALFSFDQKFRSSALKMRCSFHNDYFIISRVFQIEKLAQLQLNQEKQTRVKENRKRGKQLYENLTKLTRTKLVAASSSYFYFLPLLSKHSYETSRVILHFSRIFYHFYEK